MADARQLRAHSMAFYWEDLLEDIVRHRKVVPVIGADLLGVTEPGGSIPFYRQLAAQTAKRLGETIPAETDWPEFLELMLRRVRHRGELTRALSAAHREVLGALANDALPEPLRLLAQITDFPLVLTTAIDGLAERAFGVADEAALVSTLSENVDLPAAWEPAARGQPPVLIHLFGRIAATPGFALTEEDLLEFMWNLHGERRPARLLSRIRRSHVLLLGNRFPDWFARFFLRLLRGERLSLESETFEAVADPEARAPRPLVTFLQHFSPQTRVYEEGSAADFVRELHARWTALQPKAAPAPAVSTGPGPRRWDADDEREPSEMRPGSIFLSYASEDHDAATAVATTLDRAGLDVWFDRNELRGGDRYAAKIRRYIQQCDLFAPLLSRNTEARQDAFFRREWSWARERLPSIGPLRPFIMPLVIDDHDAYRSPDLQLYFEMPGREVHVAKAVGGALDERAIDDFVRAIRQVRAPRPAVV